MQCSKRYPMRSCFYALAAFLKVSSFSTFVIFAFEPDHAGSPPITQLLVDALPRHPDQARKIALRNSEIDANRITIFAAVGLGQPKKLSRKPRTRIEKNGILDQGLASAQA